MHESAQARLLAEDEAARASALDVSASFLVQAPAGSGKTELLIQRYLALLAGVDEPERIVALTFTRKAAGEMRERVLKALVEARDGVPVDQPHKQATRRLADAALEQALRRGWAITEHASRLHMSTFDALATSLARRAPLSAGLGPHPEYLDDASPLYRVAAQALVTRASADDPNWRALLVHLDNNAARVASLIADLLKRRDQWLRELFGKSPEQVRTGLEQALRIEIAGVLETTRSAFPEGIGREICARAREAAVADAEYADALSCLARGGDLPAATIEALPEWRTLARFLMVKGCWHFWKQVTVREGFPVAGEPSGAEARRARKDAMASLCDALNAVPGLASALATASKLPDPRISDDAWRIVEALLPILWHATGHLWTAFAAERKVDFVQGNLAALEALGTGDAPEELLLRLDATVQHLLVDEFQDTSYMQLELLRRLTAGWQPGDGRTLFAVGDPMQSIYRFREAEVGLFIESQLKGAIAALPVKTLRLRRNFRSQANLVDWTNALFEQVLGNVSDPARGAVAFESAVAARPPQPGVAPTVELCETPEDEASRVIERIREAQGEGSPSIAVLVRARAHLLHLLPSLRRAGIAFAAVELDKLSQRQAVIDLCALTHALLQPGDRTAWLAVLRAPWCGLTLADLFAIVTAAGAQRNALLLPILHDIAAIPGLSPDGRARLSRALEALRPAIDARARAKVADRVRGAWLALGGPACLDDPLDVEAAGLYFDLVARHEVGGDVPDWTALSDGLDTLHASPQTAAAAGVQVMTMHKAKGLQFDTVILPGLASKARPGDAHLLRWRRRDAGLLIAPGKARGGEADPLYVYLGLLQREADAAELGRLLYVACTRAQTRLHLVAATGVNRRRGEVAWNEPVKTSSLAKLWPTLSRQVNSPETSATTAPPGRLPPPLTRLPLDYRPEIGDPGVPATVPASARDLVTPPFDWARETTRRIGTLAHRWLARIAEEGLHAWSTERVASLQSRVSAELASAGFSPDELPHAANHVLGVVQRTLGDPRGQWLFDSAHEAARSEWALSGVDGGAIVRVVVDRTFVVNGERWIVDFKSGTHEGGDADAFLASEVERYRGQMTRYARMMKGIDPRPVRLALYYPLIEGGFREMEGIS